MTRELSHLSECFRFLEEKERGRKEAREEKLPKRSLRNPGSHV
jgi:hypothetical protein